MAIDEDWFPVTKETIRGRSVARRRVRFLADAGVPDPLVDEVRDAGVSIVKLGPELRNREDNHVLQIAQRLGRVLLTMDRDFWDDHKYPVHLIRNGVLYVAEAPGSLGRTGSALSLAYFAFAKHLPLGLWREMKVRATVDQFE
ncbi:MAG TPA: DUF5615 family PIN-like protein, partial [Myxococcota bacterium]|nr:DUF5615 family PIN-like protein [Myxococcota bacterium]